jgi:hypothetical protein
MPPTIDTWNRCYDSSWNGLIVSEAYSHPAKFSRALIQRIYQHCSEQGWLPPGSTVIDPFGGIAAGAWDAAMHNVQWIGVELEENFNILSHKNILFWMQKGWCTCGDHDRAYLSMLQEAVSTAARRSQPDKKSQDGAILFESVQQYSTLQGEHEKRDVQGEASGQDTLEQREALGCHDQRQDTPASPQRQQGDGEEWTLARGTLPQPRWIYRDTSQRQEKTGTSACHGAETRPLAQTQRVGAPSQPRQDGQSPRQFSPDDGQRPHETPQSPGTAPDTQACPLSLLPAGSDDDLHRRSHTNRVFLANLQARTIARRVPTVPKPEACQTCGKLIVPLPVMLQGDSRRLGEVLREQVTVCVSSLPYAESAVSDLPRSNADGGGGGIGKQFREGKRPVNARKKLDGTLTESYGTTPGNLGPLPEGLIP